MREGTCTEPGSHTRERSLRSRSTIMRFSARVLGSAASARAASASSAGSASRAAVPLIGLVLYRPSRPERNRSGEAETTAHRRAPVPCSSSAAYGAGWCAASSWKRTSGSTRSPGSASKRVVRHSS
ncbi:hypothetical protein GY12_07840 [Micrococcus luteus]|nr:hypothetical protein GY12_07840 [Micrococcus luteus]